MRTIRVNETVSATDVDEAVSKAKALGKEHGIATVSSLSAGSNTATMGDGSVTSFFWDVEIEGFPAFE